MTQFFTKKLVVLAFFFAIGSAFTSTENVRAAVLDTWTVYIGTAYGGTLTNPNAVVAADLPELAGYSSTLESPDFDLLQELYCPLSQELCLIVIRFNFGCTPAELWVVMGTYTEL